MSKNVKKPIKSAKKAKKEVKLEVIKRPVGRPLKNEAEKKTKTFKEYYTDPEFRKKHLEYVSARIECECGFETSRNNLSKHRQSHLHTNRLKSKTEEAKSVNELIKAKQDLDNIVKLINKLIVKNSIKIK